MEVTDEQLLLTHNLVNVKKTYSGLNHWNYNTLVEDLIFTKCCEAINNLSCQQNISCMYKPDTYTREGNGQNPFFDGFLQLKSTYKTTNVLTELKITSPTQKWNNVKIEVSNGMGDATGLSLSASYFYLLVYPFKSDSAKVKLYLTDTIKQKIIELSKQQSNIKIFPKDYNGPGSQYITLCPKVDLFDLDLFLGTVPIVTLNQEKYYDFSKIQNDIGAHISSKQVNLFLKQVINGQNCILSSSKNLVEVSSNFPKGIKYLDKHKIMFDNIKKYHNL